MKNLKSINSIIIVGAIIFALSGCKKDEDANNVLPDANSMDISSVIQDFSKKKSALVNDTSTFVAAKNAVAFWSGAAIIHSALPVLAFKTAIANKPVYNAELNTYTWSFSFKSGVVNYLAELSGEVNTEEDSILWEMNISIVNSDVPAFKYFEGKSAMDRSGGWWIIYYKPANASMPYLKIDWKLDKLLKYTNIIAEDSNKGAYIEFGKVVSTTFDKYFKISGNTQNGHKTYTIEWNSIYKNGKVSDGINSLCWDTNYLNTTCE